MSAEFLPVALADRDLDQAMPFSCRLVVWLRKRFQSA
jgi:hypothetical protein